MPAQRKRAIAFAIIAVVVVVVGASALGIAVARPSGATPDSPDPTVVSGSQTIAPTVGPVASSSPTAPSPVLGGSWTDPTDSTAAASTSLKLGATPTATPSGVAITTVRFTIGWQGVTARTACTATKPTDGAEWSCTADLARLGAPAGDLILGFEVVDDAGDVIKSPDGTRTVAYVGPPAATWSKPQRVAPADCASITAVIDGGGGYHVAAVCDGGISYFAPAANGWKTTRLKPPAARQELDPQLAFEGDLLYVAYTRVAIGDGGCGDLGIDDLGVYYRTRTLPDGAWSEPKRIGEVNDSLHAFRVVDGVLHATVVNGDNGHAYYETVSSGSTHRYVIPKVSGVTSLRIGDDGRARIAYESRGALWYATFNGSGFTTKRIPGSGQGYDPVLVLGDKNQPHLMWHRGYHGGGCVGPDPLPTDGTYYSTLTNGTWHSERLSSRQETASLTVDTDTGRVHLIVSGKGGRLVYLTRIGSKAWSKHVLDPGVVWPGVIRLDPDTGGIFVAYIRFDDDGNDVFVDRVYVVTKR